MSRKINYLAVLAALVLLAPERAMACATCYGASDSPLAQGMNWGIMVLLCCIAGVLFTVTSFFVYIVRRANSTTDKATTPVSTPSQQ